MDALVLRMLAESSSVVAALFSIPSIKSLDVTDMVLELSIRDSEHSFSVFTISRKTPDRVRIGQGTENRKNELIQYRNMVKHIILWKLREDLSEEQKAEIKLGIKEGLEGLSGKVPGLLDIKVQIDGRLDSSNADVMLDSTLESPEALKGYAKHPAHVAVADSKVRPYTAVRTCLDYEF